MLDPDYPVKYILHQSNKVHGLTKMDKGDVKIPEGTKLLILPDAGTNDIAQLNKLDEQGISCLVLDHHQQENHADNCNAVIVNNQISDKYTDKDYSGAGITHEFVRALDDYYLYDYANDFLDLVAFANISDVMSMKDFQTRYYVNKGMKSIKNKFLKALDKAQEFSTKGEINIHNIQWYWTPIVNSMIRIGSFEDRDLLFRAFIETNETFPYQKRGSSVVVEEDIYTRAARLCKNIKSRQDKIRDELCEELKEDIDPEDKIIMLAAPEDADPGIIGLAAMRIADFANKPCILLRESYRGVFSGSCRNCRNSPVEDLKSLVDSTKMFNWGLGHANAFGVEIYEENLVEAKETLNDMLSNIEYDTTFYCDFVLDAYDLGFEFIKAIDDSKFLYGTELDEPLVAIENVVVGIDDCMIMGSDKDSVAFMSGGIKYCKFKCKEHDDLLDFANGYIANELILNVVGKCSINTYRGTSTAQFIIDDYEIISMS